MHLNLTFSVIITQLVNGFALGMLFILMAVGLTIIMGLMRVINFTHGILYTLGAYTVITLQKIFGFWPILAIAPACVGMIGMAIEASMIRPIYKRDPLYTLLLTFGVALVLEDVIRLIWGDAPYPMAAPQILSGVVNIGVAYFSKYRIFVILFTSVLLFGVWYFLERSQVGKTILAGTFDREMVVTLGIKIDLLFTLVFGIGAGLAAIAGVLASPIRGVFPPMGTDIIMPSFVVVIIGGMGSFWGAVIGGLLVGVVKSFTVEIYSPMADVIVFFLLAIVLLVRPRGISGIEGLLE
ncbi:MAG: branched-chain amino acid ABC transporter permease [Thermodesulfobacteriota bacterium]|jgi:branched-chain amino acid transport system permease protein